MPDAVVVRKKLKFQYVFNIFVIEPSYYSLIIFSGKDAAGPEKLLKTPVTPKGKEQARQQSTSEDSIEWTENEKVLNKVYVSINS